MKRREELNRRLVIFALTAPAAVLVGWIFRAVYENLSVSAKAVGYVDPMTQAGIDFGYGAMIVGTLALGVTALWSAIAAVRLLLQREE